MQGISSHIQSMLAGSASGSTSLEAARQLPNHEEVGESFESVFISMMVKQLRQTAGEEGFFAGDKSDTMGGMFDMYMGQHLAKASDLGIGSMVRADLERAAKDATDTPQPAIGGDSDARSDRTTGIESLGT